MTKAIRFIRMGGLYDVIHTPVKDNLNLSFIKYDIILFTLNIIHNFGILVLSNIKKEAALAVLTIVAGIAVKFGVVAAINDAGYEGVVRVLRTIQPNDPTGMSTKMLRFLESDQNILEGVTLMDNVNVEHVQDIIKSSDLDVEIITAKQAQKIDPEIDVSLYHLFLSGKPKPILEINSLIMHCARTIKPYSSDNTMNTVFGRLYQMAMSYAAPSKVTEAKPEKPHVK